MQDSDGVKGGTLACRDGPPDLKSMVDGVATGIWSKMDLREWVFSKEDREASMVR